MTQPGFNCVCCCLGEAVAGGMSLRIQQIDCRCETKTKDNVFVDINITVQYQIERENLYDAFYKLTDSRWVVGLLLLRGWARLSCLSRLLALLTQFLVVVVVVVVVVVAVVCRAQIMSVGIGLADAVVLAGRHSTDTRYPIPASLARARRHPV